jgi:deferrochelatase/peroxidase EfeB
MTNSVSAGPDKANIQGLALRGYTHPYSMHLLFGFGDASGVPAFFRSLLPYLQSADDWGEHKPAKMLNIGLTWNGVHLLHPEFKSINFPRAFVAGPASGTSQTNLNDTAESDPKNWWSKNFASPDIHCIVHAYAMTAAEMDGLVQEITDAARSCGVKELLPFKNAGLGSTVDGRLAQSQLKQDYIHFDYRDSIDQPGLNGRKPEKDPADLSYFLIGYAKPDPVHGATPSPTTGAEGIFAKDGCYNAFRVLHQDARAFEALLDEHAPKIAALIPPQPDVRYPDQVTYAREWLAARLNGRWRDGTPLVLSPGKEDPTVATATEYSFTGDTQGLKCPFSAHTRVANPRDEELTLIARPVPRLVRRGAAYGAAYDKTNPGVERGLIGLFLCGDISSQFEKLYAWINFNNFSDVFTGMLQNTQDALVGNRTPNPGNAPIDASFTIPLIPYKGGPDKYVIPKLPQLVVTRGTAYCLLPSIKAIKEIAGAM